MQFNLKSHANHLTVLFIAIALISFSAEKSLTSKVSELSGYNSRISSDLSSLKSLMTDIEKLSAENPADYTPPNLTDAVSTTMLMLRNESYKHGVTVGYAAPAKALGGAYSTIDVLKDDVPDTSLAGIRINVNGSYTSYSEFLKYIESIQASAPVAVVSARIIDHDFQLSIRVYGTK